MVFKPSDGNDDEMSFPSSNDSNSDTSEGTISSITLTPEEVYHVLVALNESKATGLDKIPVIVVDNYSQLIRTLPLGSKLLKFLIVILILNYM